MWQERTTNSYLQKRNQIDAGDQLSCLLIYNTINSQEFNLIPKENYFEEQPKSSEIVFNPTISEKADQLTLLQRQKPTVGKEDNSTLSQMAENQLDIVEKMVLNSIFEVKARTAWKNKANLQKNLRSLGCRS